MKTGSCRILAQSLFFFFGAQTDFNIEGFQRSGNASGLTNLVQRMAEHNHVPYEIELQQFNQGFHKKFSILIAFGVLGFAYAVHLMYRKKEVWFGRSLIFAIHFYCLFFVILLLWRLALHYLNNAGIQTPMQGYHGLMLIFLALSIRRVWPEKARVFIPKVLFLWFNAILVYSLSIALGIGLQIFFYGRIVRQVIGGK